MCTGIVPVVDGTACDDGDTCSLGDGCVAGVCTPGPKAAKDGTACDDGEPCTLGETCVAATCTPASVEPDTTPCDDGESCTVGDACQSGVCLPGAALPDGAVCADGTLCTAGDLCASGVCTGMATPQACRVPIQAGKAAFQLVDKPGRAKDKLKFKWGKGEATLLAGLGDPVTADDYELCLFRAGESQPLLTARAPAAGVCPNGAPCWRQQRGKLQYKDKAATPDGVTKLQLKPGPDGKAQAQLQGAGVRLTLPAPPLAGPLRVELRTTANGGAVCWGADLPTLQKNVAGQLKAKGP